MGFFSANPPHMMRGTFVDLDTGTAIRFVRTAAWDNATLVGDVEAYRAHPRELERSGVDPKTMLYTRRCRFRYTPASPLLAPPAKRPPLPGAHCPVNRPMRGVPIVPLADRRCQHYACDRVAEWLTAELENRPAVEFDGVLFRAVRKLRTRFWCSWHYEAPPLLDGKGELITRMDEIGARPQ